MLTMIVISIMYARPKLLAAFLVRANAIIV